MDIDQSSHSIETLLEHRVKLARRVSPQLAGVDEALLRLALTSAHRDDGFEYADGGNRDLLAPNGAAAIDVCIRSARLKKSAIHRRSCQRERLQYTALTC